MRLRVITYNIHRAIGVDRRFRIDRIARILEHHDADVALLQEVDSGAPRSSELDLARELADMVDYPYYAVGHNVDLRKGRYGNATLSRYPIMRERNIDLTIDSRKRRGCQHTTIQIERPGGHTRRLDVFNLHLGLSGSERTRQLGLLVRSHEFAALDPSHTCLVGGDFNDWMGSLPPIFTEILGFDSATDRDDANQRPVRTYPSFSPTGGLDKIFFRGRLRLTTTRVCRLPVSKIASDHLPVIADFEL